MKRNPHRHRAHEVIAKAKSSQEYIELIKPVVKKELATAEVNIREVFHKARATYQHGKELLKIS